MIPAGRIDPNGQALLNLFPVPNAVDPQRQYNYTFQSSYDHPRNDQVLRVDWNVASEHHVLFAPELRLRGLQGRLGIRVEQRQLAAAADCLRDPQLRVVNTLLHTFSPTLVAEVTVGLNHGKQTVEPLTQADLERNDRTQVGLASLPQFYPGGEPVAHPPQRELRRRRAWRSAAALRHIATLGVEGRYPFFGQNDIWNTSANLTKVMGRTT